MNIDVNNYVWRFEGAELVIEGLNEYGEVESRLRIRDGFLWKLFLG